MRTLHKIDREKLAEALQPFNSGLGAEYLFKAADNWLTITDPEFEVSNRMLKAADDAQEPYCTEDIYATADLLVAAFKAMIAKAGE